MTVRERGHLLVAAALLCLLGAPVDAQTLDREHLTWNVGTINPFGFRLPKSKEGRVVQRIATVAPDTFTLQELRSDAQAQRLQAGLVALGHVYAVEVAENNPSRPDGRLIATFYANEQLRERKVWTSSVGYGALALVFDSGWTLVNVHAPAGFYRPRRVYFNELATWLATLPGELLLAGDLNLGPRNGAGIGAFLPWARRYDRATFAMFRANFGDYTTLGATTLYGFGLDHVFVRTGGIQSQQRFKGWGRFPMDHRPILAEVRMGQPAPAPTGSP